jgi:hypothetical protein
VHPRLRLLTVGLFAGAVAAFCAWADVTSYSLFKTANYHQTSPAQPTAIDAPNAYFCGLQLFADTNVNEVVTNVAFFDPDNNFYVMDAPYSNYFDYGSPFYPDQVSLDAAFPAGDYLFVVDVDTNSQLYADSADLFLNNNALYTTTVPYFTGNSWSNMLSLDPSVAQSFTWNEFATNLTSDVAYIFFRAIDTSNFNAPAIYIGDFLSPTNTGVTAPPNLLQNGINYRVELLFSDRYGSVGGGFVSGAAATVGFDVLTYAYLNTIPPALTISNTGGAIVLSWPGSASNYQLQYTRRLGPQADWGFDPDNADLINGTYYATNDLPSATLFFRLRQTQN